MTKEITRDEFDRACDSLSELGGGQPPHAFGAQVMTIALYAAQVARAMDVKARMLPYPHHAHQDGWTCNECEEVRLYNERIASGGTR